ncbi:MAG: response regulator, partial [Candidatus Aerophobetes bacterium]|nr:response regulator [Candidatus Aerophobetes bacterium]
LVRVTLEDKDYEIINASGGKETLKKARLEKPDLLLLDIVMPGMDGFEVCRQLRRELQPKQIPIIMLTAKGEEADKKKGREVGANDYITKPFSPSALLSKIEEILA